MSDRYLELSHTPFGKALASLLGLPQPPRLKRASGPWAQQPLIGTHALVGASTGAQFVTPTLKALVEAGASLRSQPEHVGLPLISAAAQKLGAALVGNPAKGSGDAPSSIYIFDGSGLANPAQIRELYDFMQPVLAGVPSNGRILILSRAPAEAGDAAHVASATALRGFIRALGKAD